MSDKLENVEEFKDYIKHQALKVEQLEKQNAELEKVIKEQNRRIEELFKLASKNMQEGYTLDWRTLGTVGNDFKKDSE